MMFKNLTNISGESPSLYQNLDDSIALNLNNNYLTAEGGQGQALPEQGRERLTKNDLTDGPIITSDEPELQIWQGIKLEKQGKLNLAISHYRQAIELDSECAQAYQMLSRALKKVRKQRKLESIGNRINTENSTLPDISVNKGKSDNKVVFSTLLPSLEKKTNLQYSDFLNINLKNLSIANSLNSQQQSESSSIVLLPQTDIQSLNNDTLQQNLSVAQVYVQQALVYFDQQQWEQSISACQAALRICPDLAEAYKIWGNSLQKSGKTAEAMGLYAKALAVQPNMAEIYSNLGSIYAKQKKWQQAIQHYQKSLIIDPECAAPYRNLARVWDKLGEFEKASECFFRALKLSPEILSAEQHFELANNLYEEGKICKAIDCYTYAIKLQPQFLNAYLKLAEALEKNGQIQEAAFYYKKVAQLQASTANTPALSKTSQQIRNILNSSAKTLVPEKAVNHEPQSQNKAVFQLEAAKTPTIAAQIEECRREAQLQPNSLSALINLGNLYFGDQQWQNAIYCYQRGIKLAPKVAEPYINLGKALSKIGDKIAANQAFYRGFSLEPEKIAAKNHVQLGNELVTQQQTDYAMVCYRRAIQLEPSLVDAYLSMGAILENKSNLAGAIACYRRLVQLQPESTEAHKKLRELVSKQQGQQRRSINKPQVALAPRPSQNYFNMGENAEQEQNWQLATACYRKAIEIDCRDGKAFHNLGNVLAKQKLWPDAIKAYLQGISIESKDYLSHHNLGEAYLELEQWQQAAEAFSSSISLKRDFCWSHYNLGTALMQLKQWQQAAHALHESLKLNPNFDWGHHKLGDVLVNLKDWDGAASAYRRALEINPNLPKTEGKLTDALGQRHKVDRQQLTQFYHQAIEQEPENESLYYKALELTPDNPEMYIKLAQINEAKGEKVLAISFYRIALQLQPDNLEIRQTLERLKL